MSKPNLHRASACLRRAKMYSKDVMRTARKIEEAAEALGMDSLRERAAKIRARTNQSEHSIPDYIDRALEEIPT